MGSADPEVFFTSTYGRRELSKTLPFFFSRQGRGVRLRQSRLLHEEFQSASHSIAGRSVGVVEGVFFESARFMISAVGSTVPFSFRVDH